MGEKWKTNKNYEKRKEGEGIGRIVKYCFSLLPMDNRYLFLDCAVCVSAMQIRSTRMSQSACRPTLYSSQ